MVRSSSINQAAKCYRNPSLWDRALVESFPFWETLHQLCARWGVSMVDGISLMTPGATSPLQHSLDVHWGVSAKVAQFLAELLVVKVVTSREFRPTGSGSRRSEGRQYQNSLLERTDYTYLLQLMTWNFPLVSSNSSVVLVGCNVIEMRKVDPFCSTLPSSSFNSLKLQSPVRLLTWRCPSLFTRLAPLCFWLRFLLHLALSCQASASNQYLVWGRLTLSLAALSEPASHHRSSQL